MKTIRATLVTAFLIAAGLVGIGPAHAQTTNDCGKRDPAFPGYDSSEVLRDVETAVGTFPIRRGFYCVPDSAKGNERLEADIAFGFGYDKVRYRHAITKIKIIEFPLKKSTRPIKNSDGNYNFLATARKGKCYNSGTNCEITERMPVVAVASPKNADEYWGMPAGRPVGLLTFYCDYGDPYRLRCPDWVNTALDIFK